METLQTESVNKININDQLYYTVKDFAKLTNRTEQSVRLLISKGNRVRKLKVDYIAGKPLIPCEELTGFPFTTSGRGSEIYYLEEGTDVGV